MPKSIFAVFVAMLAISWPGPAADPDGTGPVTAYGSLRSRVELWDWFDGAANDSYPYSGSLLRLGLQQQGRTMDWNVEVAAPLLLGLPDDATAPPPQGGLGLGQNYYTANQRSRNAAMAFPKQAWIRFHAAGGAQGHSLRLGRFEFADGSEAKPGNPTLAALKTARVEQRLIGPFGFSHVGRSFDGFDYRHTAPNGTYALVGAFPTRGVFQVDGWGFLKTGFAYGSWTRPVKYDGNAGELRLFGIYYHDWRPLPKTDNRPGAVRALDRGNVRIGSFGGHYIHAQETAGGTADLLVWGVAQTGRWGSQDHRAGAAAVEAGFQPAGMPALRPWLRGGFFWSSGDDDPGDDRHDTFSALLPTPRVYARFPFFNLMNLQDYFGELVLRPGQRVTMRTDVHALRLSSREDLWYAGGGPFNPWVFGFAGRPSGGGRGLATLYDVSVDIKATSHVSVAGYYGYANGKSVMAAIYPDGKNAQFGYLELALRF